MISHCYRGWSGSTSPCQVRGGVARRRRSEDRGVPRRVEESERSLLLRELMWLELELERGAGRFPDRSDYRRRFAGDLRLIDQVFREEERPRDSNTPRSFGVPTPSDDVARLCEGTETTEGSSPCERRAVDPSHTNEIRRKKPDADIRPVYRGEWASRQRSKMAPCHGNSSR